MNVITLAGAIDIVKIFAVGVALCGAAERQQMSKVLNGPAFVFPRVFDPRSCFDLNHATTSPFFLAFIRTFPDYF